VIFFFLSLYYVAELTGLLLLFVPMFKVPPFLLHEGVARAPYYLSKKKEKLVVTVK